jgi:hypothetical protein
VLHTDVTGAYSIEFCSGGRFGEFPIVLCCGYFEFGSFWSSGGQVCVLGLRGLDRSDRRATPARLV